MANRAPTLGPERPPADVWRIRRVAAGLEYGRHRRGHHLNWDRPVGNVKGSGIGRYVLDERQAAIALLRSQ
jgi:hypothetical protein